MLVDIKGLKLAMVEAVVMKDRTKNAQGVWEDNGKTIEKTQYTFKDTLTHEKIVLFGKNDFRGFEGKIVNVQVDIKYNDFAKQVKLGLGSISEALV